MFLPERRALSFLGRMGRCNMYYMPETKLGVCPCVRVVDTQCACAGWWCSTCLYQHTSGPGGRCPTAMVADLQKVSP